MIGRAPIFNATVEVVALTRVQYSTGLTWNRDVSHTHYIIDCQQQIPLQRSRQEGIEIWLFHELYLYYYILSNGPNLTTGEVHP